MNDLFEQGLRGELRERQYISHPSFAVLFGYAQSALEAPERGRVSAHIARCRRCQEEVVAIRFELAALERALPRLGREALAQPSGLARLRAFGAAITEKLWGRPALYGHVAVYATAALVLIALNFDQLQSAAGPGYQGGGGVWWVQWPLLAWGGLLIIHLWRSWKRR